MGKEIRKSQKDALDRLLMDGLIKAECDLCGDDGPSPLFPPILSRYAHLLRPDDRSAFSDRQIKLRAPFSALIRGVGRCFYKTKQLIEDPGLLDGTGRSIDIPKGPVIFAANHHFRDDVLGTIVAAGRHSYVLFGSLPHFYNTIDGPLLSANGVVLVNRKIADSRRASVDKLASVLRRGCSVIIFPEGVWNKDPCSLTLPLYRGVWLLAKETGLPVVPVAHYIPDPSYGDPRRRNAFHTVVGEAIDMASMQEEEALEALRTALNTWIWLMMERYGGTTREELLGEHRDANAAWEDALRRRVATAGAYDREMETTADLSLKGRPTIGEVFAPICDLPITAKNAHLVSQAMRMIELSERSDYQHRF